MKKKRQDLLEIGIERVAGTGAGGEFNVTLYNGTGDAARNAIGIESNFPVVIMLEGKILNKNGITSITCETKPVTIPPASTRTFLFHWKDMDDEFKEIQVRAMFKHLKTPWEGYF